MGEIQAGDVVRLKIGGPEMIVHSFREVDEDNDYALCVRFDEEGRKVEEEWPVRALEKRDHQKEE